MDLKSLTGNILVVDDQLANLRVLTTILKTKNYKVRKATSGESAIEAAQMEPPDLILLDIKMPGMNGYEVCQNLKSNDKTKNIPIVFISVLNEVFNRVKAFEMGGVDYIIKPFHEEDVLARVNAQLTIQKQKKILEKEIRQRKEAEVALKKAKDIAEKANNSKSAFLGHVSHEIRNQMNSILGFSEILKRKKETSKNLYYIESIHKSGLNLLALINNVLDISKIEAGKLEMQYSTFHLSSFLKNILDIFLERIEDKNLKFIISLDTIPPLMLDEFHFKQVVTNLVSNAIKFTHKGTITVKGHCVYPDEKKQDSATLFLSVEDSGIGIPKEQLNNIFNAFEQATGKSSRKYQGTGLGLAISERIIESMEGSITVTSTLGQGSCFTIEIPNLKIGKNIVVDQHKQPDFSSIIFKPAKILIVDDIDYNREIIQDYLEDLNFDIRVARNGKEALEVVEIFIPDLILMEMKMPEMDGYEVLEVLKARDNKKTPVIAVTATAFKEDEKHILKICEGFLSKPISQNNLVKQLMKFIPYSVETKVEKFIPKKPSFLLPPEEKLKQISKLAKCQNITDLNNYIEELDNSKFAMFISTIKELLAKYQFARIVQFIESQNRINTTDKL